MLLWKPNPNKHMETTPTPPVETAPPIKNMSSPPPTPAGPEDKTVAILSYCTLIGFIVAIILHQQKKTKLGAYHLRQALGFIIAGFVGWIAVAIVAGILTFVLGLIIKALALIVWPLFAFAFLISMLVLWVMGLLAAINGEMKPMPVVGPYFQKWFSNTFE